MASGRDALPFPTPPCHRAGKVTSREDYKIMEVGDVFRVTAGLRGPDGQTIQNVFHFAKVSGADTDDLDAMEDFAEILDELYVSLEDFFPDTVTADEISFFDVTNHVPLPSLGWPTFTGGAVAVEAEPPACSALVVFRTGQSRRLGRKFFGPLQDGATTGGELEAGSLVQLASAAGALLGLLSGESGHTYYAGIVSTLGGFFRFIEAVARPIIAYQRRRKQGVGI